MNNVALRAAVSCIALCTAGFAWTLWHLHPALRRTDAQAAEAIEAAARNEQKAEPRVSTLPLLPTLVAPAPDRRVPDPVTSVLPESNDEPIPEVAANNAPIPEVAAADRRAAMADFWNLTEEQTKAFDAASEAPAAERLEVMLRFARGEITKRDLNAELQSADDRGLKRVSEVLGDERFNEYLSIRGRLEVDDPEISSNP